MAQRTPLYEAHLKGDAKIVDFSGWNMPLHYGSQLEEHRKVRKDAGMFDVSHMTIVDLEGSEAGTFLRFLLANSVDKLTYAGKSLYSCMLNAQGKVIDDLIVYKISEQKFRLVVNAATREKDLAWIHKQSEQFSVQIIERQDLAMVAVQGPKACEKLKFALTSQQAVAVESLKPFHFVQTNGWMIARTGYTGEHGVEIILPGNHAVEFWRALLTAGVSPCGLGARDTLRLEAGLNLYGADMNETTSPLESNLAWTVAFEPAQRNFMGRAALEEEKAKGVKRVLVGLILEDRGVLRNHQHVIFEGIGEGEITSGSYSPTLEKAIALARVPANFSLHCHVEIRGKLVPAIVVKPPFVKHGTQHYTLYE